MHDLQPVRRSEGLPSFIEIVQVHAVYPYRPGAWCCEACDFRGSVDQAIRHAVRLQWDQSRPWLP